MLPRHSKQSIRHDPRADTGAGVISTNAAARQNLTVGDGGDGQWRRVDPHPFLVANGLNRLSYVSLQSARGSRRVVRGNALRARGPVGKAEARTCRPSAAGTAGHQNELLPPRSGGPRRRRRFLGGRVPGGLARPAPAPPRPLVGPYCTLTWPWVSVNRGKSVGVSSVHGVSPMGNPVGPVVRNEKLS